MSVCDLLRNTLYSVCSQTNGDFRVIVVCNEILDDFSNNHKLRGRIDFVEVDFDPPSLGVGAVTGVPACNLDRGLKFVIGLLAAKKYDPEYVMFFDADDFISDDITEFCINNPGNMGWYFETGMYTQNNLITYRNNFYETCGTSHILNYAVLCEDIPFDKLSVDSTVDDIKSMYILFIKGVLGCHMNYGVFFFNCHQDLAPYPLKDTAVYNMGTGENHSGKLSKCGPGWMEVRRKATRKLDRSAYRMKFPFINHKHQLIPIYTKVDRAKQVFVESGLYNPVELSHSEIRDIYGEDTCNEYSSVAVLVNPYERLVYDYYKDHDQFLISGQSFTDFIRSNKTKKQSIFVPNWVKHVIRIEELYDNSSRFSDILPSTEISEPVKPYIGHYSDYYTDTDVDYVRLKFPEDLELGGYDFEKESDNTSELPVPDDAGDTIPNILHFCYGMKLVPEEFSFVNYLAVLSAVVHNKPEKVYFHYCVEPYGKWWDLIKPYLELHQVIRPSSVFGNPLKHYAHVSDIIRMRELYRTGGIYLDLDTITWKSFEDLRKSSDCVVGYQDSPKVYKEPVIGELLEYYGICNAVIACKPGSTFMRDWYYGYANFESTGRDDSWDYHSVIYPALLCRKGDREDVTILSPKAFFFPTWSDMQEYTISDGSHKKYSKLFRESYCTHLWDNDPTVNLDIVTPGYINTSTSHYAASIRQSVFTDMTSATVSIVFLTNNRLELTARCLATWLDFADARSDVKEVLIFDNASEPMFVSWLRDLEKNNPKLRVIYSDTNEGVAGGRSVLFKEAAGDVVLSVDSDSYLRDTYFIDRAKQVLSDKHIGMCGVVGAYFSDYSTFKHTDVFDDSGVEAFVDSLAGCCQIFRRELYGSAFTMDTNFKPFWLEDTDLCLQLRHSGYGMYRINSNKGFDHEWGGTGNKLFPDSFKDKQKYFNEKWTSTGDLK